MQVTQISKYTINHIPYSFAELTAWCQNIQDAQEPEWLKQVAAFILDWLSEADFMVAKTSGSTGEPKTIHLHKAHVRASALKTIAYFHLKPADTILLALPVRYIAGKLQIVRALEGGLDLILEEPSSEPLEHSTEAIDFAAFTPQQTWGALRQLPQVKKLIVGGGAISKSLEDQLQDQPTAVYATYGMTETITHVAVRSVNQPPTDYFQALAGVVLSADASGCLVIDAPHLGVKHMATNDVVEMVASDQFRFLGRKDQVINSGGIKIFPERIEQKLSPHIEQPFFISSLPDEALGEKVILVVEATHNERKENAFLQQCQTHLDPYERPKAVFFVHSFVQTETGKLNRIKTVEKALE